MASVRFNKVTKKFGGFVAVADLDLDIVDKEFLVLLGPSGCGKTTTMRMVAGLEQVSAGDIFIGADRINDVLPKYRDVAMVFQSYALYRREHPGQRPGRRPPRHHACRQKFRGRDRPADRRQDRDRAGFPVRRGQSKSYRFLARSPQSA